VLGFNYFNGSKDYKLIPIPIVSDLFIKQAAQSCNGSAHYKCIMQMQMRVLVKINDLTLDVQHTVFYPSHPDNVQGM
jgi:hypothetical protein